MERLQKYIENCIELYTLCEGGLFLMASNCFNSTTIKFYQFL